MDNSTPKISVLIPVYNSAKFLKKCLNSVLNQTYKNLEIVIVDDGSTDNSLNILKEYEKKDNRIKLFEKKNEKSIPKTRNFLLSHKTGEYFCFIDSDDSVERTYVQKLFSSLWINNSDLACCGFKIQLFYMPIIRRFSTKHKVYNSEEIFREMVLGKTMHFMLWNKIFKSSLAQDIIFDEDVFYGEDFVFCYKYVKKCSSVSYINVPLYHYMIHKKSLMHQKLGYKQISFLQALYSLLANETNPVLIKTLKQWISFTSCYYLYSSKKCKDIEHSKKIEFAKNIRDDQVLLLKDKKTRTGYKILFRLMRRLGSYKKYKKEM